MPDQEILNQIYDAITALEEDPHLLTELELYDILRVLRFKNPGEPIQESDWFTLGLIAGIHVGKNRHS